jgi:hypothetical protein
MTVPPILLALTVQVTMVLHLVAPPESAFPMFDPVNESRWDPSWKPQLLGPRVAQGLVFLVNDDRGPSTWLLDRYDPQAHAIRYVVNAPDLLDEIDITVAADGPSRSVATVTYTRTSLNAAGDKSARYLQEHLPKHAPHWESAINAALLQSP